MNKKIIYIIITGLFFGILAVIGNKFITVLSILISLLLITINFYFEVDYKGNKELNETQIRKVNFTRIKSRMYGLLFLDIKYGIINSIKKTLKLDFEVNDSGEHIIDKKKYYRNLKALSKNNYEHMQIDIEKNPIYQDMTFETFTDKTRLAYYVENIY